MEFTTNYNVPLVGGNGQPTTPWNNDFPWRNKVFNAYTHGGVGLVNRNNDGNSIMNKNNIAKFVTDFGTP